MKIIPIYDVVLLPDINLYFGKETFKALAGGEPEQGEQVILLPTRTQVERDETEADDFYPIGVSGQVCAADANQFVAIHTSARVDVSNIVIDGEGHISLDSSVRPDIGDMSAQVQQEHLERIREHINSFIDSKGWGETIRNYMMQWSSIGEITAALSSRLMISSAEKYDILAQDSIAARTDLMEKALYEFLEISKLSSEAETAQEEDHQKLYREAAIKKQMEYLQKELDQMHPENMTELQKLEQEIKDSAMTDEARKEAMKVLGRLKAEGSSSPEYGMLSDYLSFLTKLPWERREQQPIRLDKAEEILDKDHFGLDKVKRRILQQIAVLNLKKKQSGTILLFVGAPGTGKTSIGQSIAQALDRRYVRVSLGGVRDEAEIRGHRRTYIGAMPGRIMEGISRCGAANPVMVLDEVDKLSLSYNGDPASALLEVLDPEQNAAFTDHYLNVPYDLSEVLFICTANTTDTIPEPLLNRMEVIRFPGYTAIEKFEIARRHLLPRSLESAGLSEDAVNVTDEAIRTIISDYTMEGGVRTLKQNLDRICREAALWQVKKEQAAGEAGPEGPVEVTVSNLRTFLDARKMHHEKALEQRRSGIVTGMAWTAAGGEILYIETLLTPGSGRTVITGQLGDVMKESAQIAVSLVKSLFPDKADLFEKNDLHIHVPAGAVPKDGPSAGITLTSAIASLVTGKAVSPKIAMTGEISLRGAVMPIGGLPEKLMAALRAGITTALIPEENLQDLDDVAGEVRENLTIIPVADIRDVFAQIFPAGEDLDKTGEVA